MLFGEIGEEKIYVYLISNIYPNILPFWVPLILSSGFEFLSGFISFQPEGLPLVFLEGRTWQEWILLAFLKCLYFNLHFWRIVLLDIEFFFDFFFFFSPWRMPFQWICYNILCLWWGIFLLLLVRFSPCLLTVWLLYSLVWPSWEFHQMLAIISSIFFFFPAAFALASPARSPSICMLVSLVLSQR